MKPGSKRSEVWEHFTRNENIVVCNICKKELKFYNNTSNMKEHLKRIYPASICPPPSSVSRIDEDGIVQTNDGTNAIPAPFVVSSASSVIDSTTVKPPPPKRQKQLRLYSAHKNDELSEERKNSIDRSLIEMIVKGYQPLSIVENEGFLSYS